MHIFHKWKLVGLYGEKYEPEIQSYGVKVWDGYVCDICGKTKLTLVGDYKYWYMNDLNEKIENLRKANCRIAELFKSDALYIYSKSK